MTHIAPSPDERPMPQTYRGRFAPSPTGPLHFGSLVAAVGSYLQAKACGGEWLVRMEDLDPPREIAGAADAILRTLEAFGMGWDGSVLYQSTRSPAYLAALEQLQKQGVLYACACTRREIADSSIDGRYGPVYPGTCRAGLPAGREPRAVRVGTEAGVVGFEDALQGRVSQALQAEVGDFVLRRADGLFAYQLAVVVDDAEQGMTEIVRGADLLDSTPRQIYLQRLLELPTPGYLHLPVALNLQGEKLSKQTLAHPVDTAVPVATLAGVLRFLGQAVPAEVTQADLEAFWRWAVAHWDPALIPRSRALQPSG
jgi:glutamyl-Q tRNA(Asp) synthetase